MTNKIKVYSYKENGKTFYGLKGAETGKMYSGKGTTTRFTGKNSALFFAKELSKKRL